MSIWKKYGIMILEKMTFYFTYTPTASSAYKSLLVKEYGIGGYCGIYANRELTTRGNDHVVIKRDTTTSSNRNGCA
jgi:hypothetical protein